MFIFEQYILYNEKQRFLKVLRNIDNNPSKSQRELAKNLGFSLGKFNYILNA